MEWCTETIQEGGDPLRLRNTTPCGQPCTGNVLGVGVQIICSSRTEQRAIADAEIDNTEERETVTPMRFQLLSSTMPKESKRRILQHLDLSRMRRALSARAHLNPGEDPVWCISQPVMATTQVR
jgi:hypothetical protein